MDQAPPANLTTRLEKARATLSAVGQAHLLDHVEALSTDQADQLLSQIEGIDWPEVGRLIESHVKQKPKFEMPDDIKPAPWYPNIPLGSHQALYMDARQTGEDLIRQGKVAAFTVAGGQGTRLGWDGPKGTFPATPMRGFPLFGCFAEYLIKAQEKYGTVIPWYIMTSPVNDQPTRDFLAEHDYFGLDSANVMIFPQAMMPAVDMANHKVLLADADSLALSPNGHGGSLKALWTSGAIADMKKRGIEQISYTQVDNPIVRMVDPLFIGLHALDKAQMSSKMLPKVEPLEKLGNFCMVGDKMTVIEYSNLPEELAHQRLTNGDLRFRAGSIAIHVIRVDFVESLNTSEHGFSLPWNRAEKKVAFYDPATKQTVKPEAPNAIKMETFVFDALPMCDSSIVYETDRMDEFAPVKNADTPAGEPDAVDSPASSKHIQTERAGAWLQQRGVTVPRNSEGHVDAVIEIKQTTAIESSDLASVELPDAIEPGSQLLL